MTPPSQQRIGRYELLEFLGGGMSHVYRAKDTMIGRTVAVKILTPEGCADEEVRERFLQEARMAGNISHENILNIYDYGEAEGQPFLVMEFLGGEDLRSLIKHEQTGDTQNKLRIALQIAHAMDYLHQRKIIHRDIKPDNVRVLPGGGVKLMDFGIAKLEGLSRTRAGYVVGTPYYMAPEQVRGGEITTSVDVYAFGILLFELFAGVKPLKADEIVQIFHLILNEPIDLGPLRHAGAPEFVVRMVERCTAKDPAARPRAFSEVIRELESALHPAPETLLPTVAFAPVPPPAAVHRKGVLIGAAAAVSAVIIVAAILLIPRKASPPPGMLLIPAGTFLSGEKLDKSSIHAYFIDREEVSAGDYLKFAHETGRAVPDSLAKANPRDPAADITFEDAQAYAGWAGKRLPTSLEWERAARGTDGQRFPWKNGSPTNDINVNHPDSGPWPVDRATDDRSPDGVIDMGSNVSEWVGDKETPTAADLRQFAGMQPPAAINEPWYTMRGGSYMLPVEAAETFAYQSLPARFHSPALGFRCVKDVR